MTKANDLASLLDANGDVVSSALDNVPSADLVNDTTPQLGGTLDTNTNDINFGTNVKSNYGTSAQLMMYHDGSNGWIKGNNTGNNSIAIQSGGTGSVMISGSSGQNIISQQGDAAYLHHAGFAKLITTATGVDAINTAGSSTSRFGSTYNTGANDGTLVIGNGGSGKAMLRFDYEGTNTDRARIGVSSSAQQLEFYTAGDNKRATLDASGNLLVGTSSYDGSFYNDTTGSGFVVRSDGKVDTKVAGTVANMNRTGSDGDILYFAKSGVGVGSIGVDGGDNLYLTGQSGNTGGIYMNDAAVSPAYQGVERDNYYNLGKAPARWKDLYLSGAVRIQGSTRTFNIEQNNYGLRFVDVDAGSAERLRIDASGRVTMPYQPCCFAYNSGNSNSTSATGSGVLNTAGTNVGNHFSSSTGRFTCPVGGNYLITWHAMNSQSNTGLVTAMFRVNGVGYSYFHIENSHPQSCSQQVVYSASAGDYFDLSITHFHFNGGSTFKYPGMSVVLIG